MPLYAGGIIIFLIGLYGFIIKPNLIKKLISLAVLNSGVVLLFLTLGYRKGGTAPIIEPGLGRMTDPLPQALMLTAIVIGISVIAVGLALSVLVYRKEKTLDTDEYREVS